MKSRNALGAALAAATALAAGAVATGAHAIVPVSPPFEIIQSANSFTLINKSTNLYAYGFDVLVADPGTPVAAWTTQFNWGACDSICNSSSGWISYSNMSVVFSGVATDIGPGKSSSLFFYNIGTDAPAVVHWIDLGGNLGFVELSTTGVPEPAAWALMLVGLFGLGAVLRSRRGSLSPQTA
jgi:hypothetical protein